MPRRESVMFVYNDARTDARVWREVGSLADHGWSVTVIALLDKGLPAEESRPKGRLLRVAPRVRGVAPGDPSPWRNAGTGLRARLAWLTGYWREFRGWRDEALRAARALVNDSQRDAGATVWHGHDLTGAVVADKAKRLWGGAFVYDSHELYVEAGSAAHLPGPARRALMAYEQRIARAADVIITVNESIARELGRRYKVAPPLVVMNCPVTPWGSGNRLNSPLRLHLDLGQRRVVLHHGGISEGRGLRHAAAALEQLPNDVALAILGDGELVPALRDLAATMKFRDRLYLHPSVAIEALPDWVAGADVGLVTFEAVDTNNYYGLPNKLFECLAAGVPVVASDFPEMRRVIAGHGLGGTCDPQSPSSVATAIRRVLDLKPGEGAALRARCREVASTTYSWQRQEVALRNAYERLSAT